MAAVRSWALAVCLACVAVGVLQQLVPRARFSGIKLVLTLYILVTAFSPLQTIDSGEKWGAISTTAAQETLDVQTLALEAAQATLEQQLQALLDANGLAHSKASVLLKALDDSAQVEAVEITFVEEAEKEAASHLVQQLFGQQVPLVWSQEGEPDAD